MDPDVDAVVAATMMRLHYGKERLQQLIQGVVPKRRMLGKMLQKNYVLKTKLIRHGRKWLYKFTLSSITQFELLITRFVSRRFNVRTRRT